MNQQLINAIVSELIELSKKESQNKIAVKADVSSATISQMINNNHKLIRPEMWRKVMLNLRLEFNWKTADITNLKTINDLLKIAQRKGMSIAISHNAGAGKSHTYRLYERTYENVIYIECKNSWSKKSFANQLLHACGLESFGTIEDLICGFEDHIKTLEKPIVIFDQIDKLKDSQLDLFMDFYNDLNGHCAFVLSGVPAFRKRVDRGVQRDKIGYRELYSRVGSKFIELDALQLKDVKSICEVNGVEDEQFINQVYNTCESDLRRVKREIEKYQETYKKVA